MASLGTTTLRSSCRLLACDVSLKNLYHTGVELPLIRGHVLSNCKFRENGIISPSVAKCDWRSICSRHLQTTHPIWRNRSLTLCQTFPLQFHSASSAALHAPPSQLRTDFSFHKTSGGDLYFEPVYEKHFQFDQIRYFHNSHSLRRRVNRTFSSDGKQPTTAKESESEDKEAEDGDEKLTLYQRFKKTYKEHGKVLVGVHLITSAVWFGSFFTAAKMGVDVVPLLESWDLSEKVIRPFRSGAGDVALAYLMYKLATPARYTVTLGGTNLAIRYLRKGGKMEPVKKEDTLRAMYIEGKADLKTKSIHTRGEIRRMSTKIRGRIRKGRRRDSHDRK